MCRAGFRGNFKRRRGLGNSKVKGSGILAVVSMQLK